MLRWRAEVHMRVRAIAISLFAIAALCGTERTASALTNFNVTNSGASAYVIGGANNPSLTLTRGQTYTFTLDAAQARPRLKNGCDPQPRPVRGDDADAV
jgi:hypothetical protein